MEMVLLITVREAVSLLHRTPARFTSSLRKYVTKKPKQAPCVVSVSAFSNILNEVYSERSCLTCAHGNSRTGIACKIQNRNLYSSETNPENKFYHKRLQLEKY